MKMQELKFKIQKKDVVILVPFILLIILSTYLWTNHHQKVERVLYLAQLPIIKKTIQCSNESPNFMWSLMQKVVSEQKSMSNQVAYLSPNGKLFHCESGWEDGFKGQRILNVKSRFRYASVTKVVTSAMILDLVNEGKLSLDDKLIDLIEIPEPKDKRIKQITIAMLLQHSAGFDRMKTFTPMLTMDKKPWCPSNLNYLSKEILDFEPNTQYQYSNVGYCLLGAVIEKVTHLSYRDAVEKKYSLTKRYMKFVNNDFLPDEIQYDYRYEAFYGNSWRTKFDFKDSLSAVGGLSGSAAQMVLLTRDMLKASPLNILARTPQPCAINLSDGCYGFALEPYQRKGSNFTIYNKSGYFPGVETDIFVDDQGGILAVFRGATTPQRKSLTEFRKSIYNLLEAYYN